MASREGASGLVDILHPIHPNQAHPDLRKMGVDSYTLCRQALTPQTIRIMTAFLNPNPRPSHTNPVVGWKRL